MCADITLWRALHAGLAHGADRGVHGKVTRPAAAAILRAATAAATDHRRRTPSTSIDAIDDDDDENLLSHIAESLGHVRVRLGREFKPARSSAFACASACVTRGARRNHSWRGTRRPMEAADRRVLPAHSPHDVTHGQNKPAPVVPDALMERMLRSRPAMPTAPRVVHAVARYTRRTGRRFPLRSPRLGASPFQSRRKKGRRRNKKEQRGRGPRTTRMRRMGTGRRRGSRRFGTARFPRPSTCETRRGRS